MPTVSIDGPYTIISDLLRAEILRDVRQLLHEGFSEVPPTEKERLQPREFFKVITRKGNPPDERWSLTKRSR
jgi:hypothetical protein